jgi:hypothetical protein
MNSKNQGIYKKPFKANLSKKKQSDSEGESLEVQRGKILDKMAPQIEEISSESRTENLLVKRQQKPKYTDSQFELEVLFIIEKFPHFGEAKWVQKNADGF